MKQQTWDRKRFFLYCLICNHLCDEFKLNNEGMFDKKIVLQVSDKEVPVKEVPVKKQVFVKEVELFFLMKKVRKKIEEVMERLWKFKIDFDEGLEFRDDFIEEVCQSITYVESGGKTIPMEQVAEELGLEW